MCWLIDGEWIQHLAGIMFCTIAHLDTLLSISLYATRQFQLRSKVGTPHIPVSLSIRGDDELSHASTTNALEFLVCQFIRTHSLGIPHSIYILGLFFPTSCHVYVVSDVVDADSGLLTRRRRIRKTVKCTGFVDVVKSSNDKRLDNDKIFWIIFSGPRYVQNLIPPSIRFWFSLCRFCSFSHFHSSQYRLIPLVLRLDDYCGKGKSWGAILRWIYHSPRKRCLLCHLLNTIRPWGPCVFFP